MCRELGVSTSGHYEWRNAAPSQRAKTDAELTAIMRKLHADTRADPGMRWLHAGLAAAGHRVSPKRVWQLMRATGPRGRHPRAGRRTKIRDNRPVPAPDLIGRRITAAAADDKRCSDVTYINT